MYFDNAFDFARAQRYFQYMVDGFYIDEKSTDQITVKFLLYNEDSKLASFVQAKFENEDSGSLRMTKSMTIFRPNPYDETNVWASVEVFLEAVFIVFIVIGIALEVREFIMLCQQKKRCMAYFETFWNYIDIATIVMQIVAISAWMDYLSALGEDAFAPRLSYDVCVFCVVFGIVL